MTTERRQPFALAISNIRNSSDEQRSVLRQRRAILMARYYARSQPYFLLSRYAFSPLFRGRDNAGDGFAVCDLDEAAP